MRIISKFKDYYDSAMGIGIDKTVIYNRQSKTILKKNMDISKALNSIFTITYKKGVAIVHPGVILFCGKYYPFLRFVISSSFNKNKEVHAFYSIDEYLNFLKDENKNIMLDNLKNKGLYFWNLRETDVFSVLDNYCRSLNNIHFEYDTPILLMEGVYKKSGDNLKLCSHTSRNEIFIEINPNLSNYAFYKIFPSYQAFQEIDMYLSGVLGVPNPKIINISDKDMAIKKGHGGKYSFKKPPSKKKH